MTHLVKRKHYNGAISVVATCETEEAAQEFAEDLNLYYQSHNYYAEPYDSEKMKGFS